MKRFVITYIATVPDDSTPDSITPFADMIAKQQVKKHARVVRKS